MNIKSIILTGSLLTTTSGLFAQVGEEVADTWIASGSNFFICILAGLLLAMGFQILMTMLSAATGLSAVGDVKKSYNDSSHNKSDKKSHSAADTAKKISTGTGLWALITVSISLFFASFLAVKLSLTGENFIGVTLGLIIWAAFFTGIVYLEMKTVTSMVGGLMGTATDGIRSVFSKSSESESKEVAKAGAQEQAKAMRQQMEKLLDTRHIDRKMDEYITKLQPQRLNMKEVKAELKDLLTHLEVDEEHSMENGKLIKKQMLEEARGANISKEDIDKISSAYDEISGILKKDTSKGEKAEEAMEKFTGADREQIKEYESKLKQYLQAADKEALQPGRIEQDINQIFQDPSKASGILKEKVAALDHDALVKMVSSRTDVSPEDAEKYTGYVERAIEKIRGVSTPSAAGGGGMKDEMKNKISNFINGLHQKKEYDLDNIKRDVTNLFHAAEDDNEGVIYKLEHYNKEQLLDMIKNNTSIPEDQAQPIVAKIVEARDTVSEKAHALKQKVEQKLEEAKQEALRQAENTRKVAATAAWWMLATAIFSGVASALGGMAALEAGLF